MLWRTIRVVRPVLMSALFYLVYSTIRNFSRQSHFLEVFLKSHLKVKTERSEMERFEFGGFHFKKQFAGNSVFLSVSF